MSEYPEAIDDEGGGVSLVDQLGTEGELLSRGKLNKSKLARIKNSSDIPDTFPALLYLQARHRLTGARWAGILVDTYLDLTVGVGGAGRDDILKGESVKRGLGVPYEPRIEQPSIIERYITNRDKARAYDRQKEELGLE